MIKASGISMAGTQALYLSFLMPTKKLQVRTLYSRSFSMHSNQHAYWSTSTLQCHLARNCWVSLWQMLPYAGGSAKVGGMYRGFLRVGAHSFTRQW